MIAQCRTPLPSAHRARNWLNDDRPWLGAGQTFPEVISNALLAIAILPCKRINARYRGGGFDHPERWPPLRPVEVQIGHHRKGVHDTRRENYELVPTASRVVRAR